LHYAARNGMSLAVKELLDASAAISIKSNVGQTPRDVAEKENHLDVLLVLDSEEPTYFRRSIRHSIED
jgi:ankyrin repeat protein